MNLLNLIEDITTGHDNLRALMQAGQSGQDAVLNIGGETVTLDPMEVRWMFSKYKAFNKAGRQEEFLNHLADPVKFDQHMKQLRQLIDKQKNFQGSVPGQRGVTGDTMPGQMEEDQAVEEIAMQDPNNMSAQARGKLNWENMIRDYMGNKPYTEFEFGGDRPLTLYRSQVYAILKAFGSMKPQNKVNIILNTFGDKMATVEYLDKLRAKGLMPKKVPAYVPPGSEKVDPNQMSFPGMDAPKIREAESQKKNSEITDRKAIVNPRVARAFQLARARQTAAGSDIEAFVQDELEKQTQTDQTIKDLEAVNRRQDAALKKAQALDAQQGDDISSIETQLDQLSQKLQVIKTAKPTSSQSSAAQPATPDTAPVAQQPAAAEPQAPVAPADIQQQPSDTAEPTVAKKKPAPRKKSGTTKISKPRKASKPAQEPMPNNVLPFRRPEPAVAQDELSAALQGVDMSEPGTGTYGLRETTNELHVGDPVIIQGNVEFKDKTGDVVEFGRDKNFIIVDLYNFGKHAFHASNVRYNDYVDQEDYVDEDRVKEAQTSINRFSIAQPPAGGTNKQREEFLNARDRLFRQMQSASPGEKEAIRLKIADLEGQAQSQGVKIRETGEFNRSGYNAIKSLSDWAEKMRTVRELQKDHALMQDPESKAAVEQRIGDLLKIGIKQGYVKEALNDKAMAVLRGLQQPAQPAPAAVDLNVPEPVSEPVMDLATVKKRITQLDELIRMKEQIDKLFVRAQNARGGIYPGLQSDIEDEELYGVPQSDKEYQILKDKYAKDLLALQKFIAMKKAVYREGQEALSESSALVRLKQARQALSQQGVAEGYDSQFKSKEEAVQGAKERVKTFRDHLDGIEIWAMPDGGFDQVHTMNVNGRNHCVANGGKKIGTIYPPKSGVEEQQAVKESLRPGEYHVATVTLDNGDVRKFKVKSDEGFTDVIKNFYARQGRKVANIDMDWSVQGDFYEQSIAEETQDDRNARIVAGEIEDAMAQGKEEVVKQKIKQLISVGYTLDKNGKLQRMGMYEDQALQEEQDACYRKVKARYKVWPSAYASGALVQCRKKGAANWGEGGKKK
jgi:hypothetical protein